MGDAGLSIILSIMLLVLLVLRIPMMMMDKRGECGIHMPNRPVYRTEYGWIDGAEEQGHVGVWESFAEVGALELGFPFHECCRRG